jgi:hypothetical protein
MLLISMALALQAATPPKIELLCTTHPAGHTARTLFSIDEAAKTFTAKVKETNANFGGTAAITKDGITLVHQSADAALIYRISLKTGDVESALGSLSGGGVVRLHGKCKTFTGGAF